MPPDLGRCRLSDEIQIGVDVSQGIKGLQEFTKAFDAVLRAGNQSGASVEKSLSSTERKIASLTKSMKQAERAADMASRKEKELQSRGLKTNSNGQYISAKTGQFASKAETAGLQERLSYIDRVGEREGALERMRAINAQNEFKRLHDGARYNKQVDAEAYASKQKMLDGVFKAKDPNFLQKAGASLAKFPPVSTMRGLSQLQDKLEALPASARYAMYDVAQTATVAGAALIGLGASAVFMSVSHERAFANVRRTTQTSEKGYQALQRQLEVMAMTIPVSYKELTEIASAAGQLGINSGGIKTFTETVAKLSATTNLTSDAAGTALARFKSFFAEADNPAMAVTEGTFTNLASSILKVGVNSIATETGIVNVSTQISSMGSYAGFTANQVIGLAGALSSVGVAPELARGITTRLFTVMGNAATNGGVALESFANLSGVSAAEFKAAWGTDKMAPIFTSMMQGLAGLQASGGDANKALMDLGITGSRDRPVLMRLANAAGESGKAASLLSQTMQDAKDGWIQNIELQVQYAKISETTAAKLQVLGQSFEQLLATLGNSSNGMLNDLVSWVTNLVKGFESLAQNDVAQWFSSAAIQAAILVGGFFLLIGGISRTVAALQGVGQGIAMITSVSAKAGAAVGLFMKSLTMTMGVVGVIAAIAGIALSFIAVDDAAKKAKRGVQDVDAVVEAMKRDGAGDTSGIADDMIYTASAAKDLGAEAKDASITTGDMTEALFGIRAGTNDASGAMSEAARAAQEMKLAFGPDALAEVKNQLLKSTDFKGLFDMKKPGRDMLTGMGLDPKSWDWDKIIQEGARKGGSVRKAIEEQFYSQVSKDKLQMKVGPFGDVDDSAMFMANAYMKSVEETLPGVTAEYQNAADAATALGGASKVAFEDAISGAKELDEVTQKVVDGVTQGLTKFADPKTLIGLTQTMLDVGDDAEKAAQAYEKAWTDAYGGASFKLSDYMVNFKRAGDEQKAFVDGLQMLNNDGRIGSDIIADLAAMGPEANALVKALVDDLKNNAGAGLTEFSDMWGATGYDSMMKMAVAMQLGQNTIANIMANGGDEALRAFNAALSSGLGVEEALASLNRDVEGKPVVPVIGTPTGATTAAQIAQGVMQVYVNGKAVMVPIKDGPKDTESLLRSILGWQNLMNGDPVEQPVVPYEREGIWGILNGMQANANNNPVMVPIRTYSDGSTNIVSGNRRVDLGFASGGYTGPGGKWDPAGVVHRGEFVMDAKATRAIGIGNLYSMMRAARGERSVTRGYANGGAVGGSRPVGSVTGAVSLSAETIQQIGMVMDKILVMDGRAVGRSAARANSRDTMEGVY